MSVVSLRADYRIGQTEIPTAVIQPDEAFQVHPGHPRLYFRGSDLPEIRRRIAVEYQAEWSEMITDLEHRALSRPAEEFARGAWLKTWAPGRDVAFAAIVTGDPRFITWAKQWAAALAATGPKGNDNEYRGRLQCLAVAYDWLQAWLSAAEKKAIEDAIVAHIERSWYFADQATNYVGGHSRWGNFTLAAGLLAIAEEKPELRQKLLTVRAHWVRGFFPAQGWIANEGGYHMGWAYSAAYLSGSIHHVWSIATNDSVYFPWQAKVPLFWIYGRQGDGTYPNTGDAYTVVSDLNEYQREMLYVGAGVFKDPYAAWAVKPNPDRLADILYGDKHVKPIAPDDTARPLPLARNFGHAGVVVARDGWGADSTVLQFTSPPFYSTNHQHRDANSFTLHFRGGLAIDSGLYDEGGTNHGGYGGEHWRNYFTRTIAHNAITVVDPAQKFTVLDKPASNDGGQISQRDPVALADIQPGGHAALGGITHYEDTPAYTYASGDATKAYDAQRVKLAQREIVFLRESGRAHPVVVIFDRVESAQAEFQKRFLLHTVNEPKVNGRLTVTENHGGRLSCLTLLPKDAALALVGGPGRDAWVDGKNYDWDKTGWKRAKLEPGEWRLEVSPGAARPRDYFLHVLFVDESGAKPVGAGEAELVEDGENVVVRVGAWRIQFPKENGGQAHLEKRS